MQSLTDAELRRQITPGRAGALALVVGGTAGAAPYVGVTVANPDNAQSSAPRHAAFRAVATEPQYPTTGKLLEPPVISARESDKVAAARWADPTTTQWPC